MVKLVTQNYILSNWIHDQTDPSLLLEMRGEGWESTQDWKVFKVWLSIE